MLNTYLASLVLASINSLRLSATILLHTNGKPDVAYMLLTAETEGLHKVTDSYV